MSWLRRPLLAPNNYFTTFSGRRNQLNLPYWTPSTPDNPYPQPNQLYYSDYVLNTRSLAYLSGTFIKVRSIDLGYTIPAAWAKAAFMSSARVYIQVQNPLIWSPTDYYKRNKAIDPDALSYSSRFNGNGNATDNTGGLSFDNGVNYPVYRSFIVGVNLGF
ncbi:MAG: hypothetical protein EOO62_06775 [Hymenobacter sp.]|nr:MAG: hypothetical protein EOO62_06775 [Hymenobacter sp.]